MKKRALVPLFSVILALSLSSCATGGTSSRSSGNTLTAEEIGVMLIGDEQDEVRLSRHDRVRLWDSGNAATDRVAANPWRPDARYWTA